MTDAAHIREAVFEHFMDTNLHASVRDIARRLEWSESKVRRVLADNFGSVDGTRAERVSVPKYSKSYPDMQCGYTQAWAYTPTASELRARLLAAYGRADPLDKAKTDKQEG